MDRRSFCYSLLAASSAGKLAFTQPPPAATWDQACSLRFTLHDPLEHPFYWWPRTLLTYPIEFRQPVSLSNLQLTRTDTGERIPIQFSQVVHGPNGVSSATLNFFSDLPSGAHREFVLSAAKAPAVLKPQVTETREAATIVLDSGALRVRIPATQTVTGHAPGPLMQFSRDANWIGASTLTIHGDQVTRITTTRLESGPLFLVYEVAYDTAHSGRYLARVHCVAGQEFVRLDEDMEALHPGVRGAFASTFTGFNPTHRQAPNHPFPLPEQPAPYDSYVWETIDAPWLNLDARCGSSRPIYPETMPPGQLPILLGIYQPAPGNFLIANWANFWDNRTNHALGVFIDNALRWQDHNYAYERESPALEVQMFYRDGHLSWEFPLAPGTRSTCVAFYDHQKDKDAMRQLEQASQSVQQNGLTYQVPLSFTSHTLFLQNRYGTLDLNRVKDWVLTYPGSARRPPVIFTDGGIKSAAQLERDVLASPYVCTLPLTGARQMDGHGALPGRSIVNFSPVPSRRIMGGWIDGFNRLDASLTPRQRTRLTAIYLFIAYVLASDEFMPVVRMLAGHPNYLADVKAAPPAMSFLFPDHPMAVAWADMWEKCVQLNTRYNTRPTVKTWDADGGRWTEDIGTYVWAFVRPSLRTSFLLRRYDGTERFVTPQLALMAEWLVNVLSAPFDGETKDGFQNMLAADTGRGWGVVGPGEGPRRIYPPIGAHAEQRMAPRSLWYLGACLRRFAPLAAEHAMWASRSTDQDAESAPGNEPPWDDIMYRDPDNLGTRPQLRSRKHTGYGITLRAAVGSPRELSVHLQQIDDGPNYRWGLAGEGGCGLLYFYAAGKSFSFNGSEDVGDRRDQDTDFSTNFGIYKDGQFLTIGPNVLSRPFYNLGAGQFAEIIPREAPSRFTNQQFVSRSVLLAGADYFVLYDAVLEQANTHRLSWFVRRGSQLPSIQLMHGADKKDRETQRTDHQTAEITGVWFDGLGDSMAVVSHRTDLQAQSTPYGCRVQADGVSSGEAAPVNDLIFRAQQPVRFSEGGAGFEGTAGLIRFAATETHFALFHGTQIAIPGLSISTTDQDFGIGGSLAPNRPPAGDYHAPQPTSISITIPTLAAQTVFYIDGAPQPARRDANTLHIALPAGTHRWELTESLPVPIAPQILRTENHPGGATVLVTPVPSATQYTIELSRDNGLTWTPVATDPQPSLNVTSLADSQKVHLRAIAANPRHASPYSPDYPLYVSSAPPPPPDGLNVQLAPGAATLTWGEVLGAAEYRLDLRTQGQAAFRPLYRGPNRSFTHTDPAIRPCNQNPGQSPAQPEPAPAAIYEYRVAAANANGESIPSRLADTDPASWRNWDPRPGEGFRRVYAFPHDQPQSTDDPSRYYPE